MDLKIRWRAVVAATVALVVIFSAVIVGPIVIHELQRAKVRWVAQRAAQPHPVPATDTQQLAILRTLLQEISFQGVPLPPPPPGGLPGSIEPRDIVLLSTSIVFCDEAIRNKGNLPCSALPTQDTFTASDFSNLIPRKLREELALTNETSQSIPNPELANVIFRTREVVNQNAKDGAGWAAFYKSYPQSAGTLEVSRAVLSQDRKHALIYFENVCDGLCGSGWLYYLVRTGSDWHTESKIVLWRS